MRIGVAGFGYGLGRSGGVQVYLRDLLRALDRYDTSGNEYVVMLGPRDATPQLGERFRVVRLERNPAAEPGWRRGLKLLFGSAPELERLDLDLVHYPATRVHDPVPRVAVALTFFDMQEEFHPDFFTLRERLARAALHRRGVRRAALVLAPSRFTRTCLEERYGTPGAKLRHVPVGVGERFGAPDGTRLAQDVCERFGLQPGAFVLYPANPWPHKNHLTLLRALARLERRGGAPTLVCTGRVEGERRSVRALAEQAGLPQERVHDLGFVPEEHLPGLFQAARFLVYPSLFEGFGIPLIEAMASGCPVACSSIPPLIEIGQDAVRRFDPRREEALADAIAEMWEDGALRERLAARGRVRAQLYAWERLVPDVVAAYTLAAAREPQAQATQA